MPAVKRPDYMANIEELPRRMLRAITQAASSGTAQSPEEEEACSQAILAKANEIKQAKHAIFKGAESLPPEPHREIRHRWHK